MFISCLRLTKNLPSICYYIYTSISRSSPNATGCVALLLSGLKAEDKPYTPYRIKNAIVNSGKSINDPFGIGLIQVQKAWDYLNTYYDREDQDVLFEVKVIAFNVCKNHSHKYNYISLLLER